MENKGIVHKKGGRKKRKRMRKESWKKKEKDAWSGAPLGEAGGGGGMVMSVGAPKVKSTFCSPNKRRRVSQNI